MQIAQISGDIAFRKATQIAMTSGGLIYGTGVILAGMSDGTAEHLALDRDRDRLLAMLSVIAGEPVAAAKVLPHVEAASQHWRRGDKALANLRLVFAGLPSARDATTLANLRNAAALLDGGIAPKAPMKALWPYAALGDFAKYSPDQRRVPAGHGVESGRWEADGQGGDISGRDSEGRIDVAVNFTGKKPSPEQETDFTIRDLTGDPTSAQRAEPARDSERIIVAGGRPPLPDDDMFEERELLGETTPEEEFAHGRPINPLNQTPLILPLDLDLEIPVMRFGEAGKHL